MKPPFNFYNHIMGLDHKMSMGEGTEDGNATATEVGAEGVRRQTKARDKGELWEGAIKHTLHTLPLPLGLSGTKCKTKEPQGLAHSHAETASSV